MTVMLVVLINVGLGLEFELRSGLDLGLGLGLYIGYSCLLFNRVNVLISIKYSNHAKVLDNIQPFHDFFTTIKILTYKRVSSL